MSPILTLTMNPALDVSTSVDKVQPVHKLRCEPAAMHPGGGGINVARVVHRLGADSLAIFPAGGATGEALQALLHAEQVPCEVVAIQGETRESFSVHETASGQDFRFVLPGPTLSQPECLACLATLKRCMTDRIEHGTDARRTAGWLVLSGSLPPGAPDDFYAQAARLAAGMGFRVVLDASGLALRHALQAGVDLVKPSLRELRELTGQPLPTEADWRQAARRLIEQGQARLVAVSLGEDGALLVSADAAWRAPALKVDVASTIGAGDSFVGGMVWALSQGHAPAEAFRWGMAASAAALRSAGTTLCHPEVVATLFQDVAVTS